MILIFTAILMGLAAFGTYRLVSRVIAKELEDITTEDAFIAILILVLFVVSLSVVLENIKI